MKLSRRLYVYKNRRTSSLKFSVSYEKDTTKDSESKQLIQPWPNRTKPREFRFLKLARSNRTQYVDSGFFFYIYLSSLNFFLPVLFVMLNFHPHYVIYITPLLWSSHPLLKFIDQWYLLHSLDPFCMHAFTLPTGNPFRLTFYWCLPIYSLFILNRK